MSDEHVTPEEHYESLCRVLLDDPAVARESGESPHRTGFGPSALKVDGKIFAMLVRGRLVVKLPQHRVDALVAAGRGERYDPGGGRLMKEWVTVEPRPDEPWPDLAREAREFVARQRAA